MSIVIEIENTTVANLVTYRWRKTTRYKLSYVTQKPDEVRSKFGSN